MNKNLYMLVDSEASSALSKCFRLGLPLAGGQIRQAIRPISRRMADTVDVAISKH